MHLLAEISAISCTNPSVFCAAASRNRQVVRVGLGVLLLLCVRPPSTPALFPAAAPPPPSPKPTPCRRLGHRGALPLLGGNRLLALRVRLRGGPPRSSPSRQPLRSTALHEPHKRRAESLLASHQPGSSPPPPSAEISCPLALAGRRTGGRGVRWCAAWPRMAGRTPWRGSCRTGRAAATILPLPPHRSAAAWQQEEAW